MPGRTNTTQVLTHLSYYILAPEYSAHEKTKSPAWKTSTKSASGPWIAKDLIFKILNKLTLRKFDSDSLFIQLGPIFFRLSLGKYIFMNSMKFGRMCGSNKTYSYSRSLLDFVSTSLAQIPHIHICFQSFFVYFPVRAASTPTARLFFFGCYLHLARLHDSWRLHSTPASDSP